MRSLRPRRFIFTMPFFTVWDMQTELALGGAAGRSMEGFEWRLGRETVIHPLPPRR